MKNRAKLILLTFSGMLFLSFCSMNTLVIRQMEPIMLKSSEALYEEEDLQLAEQALAANLKLIEGLLKNDPGNQSLLMIAAQGYAGYALGFIEDEDPERARVFYLRARDYALQELRKNEPFRRAEDQDLRTYQNALAAVDKNKVAALFWAGFAWAGYANLSLQDPAALIALPKIQRLMDRVQELDPKFFYGAVYLYQGSVYGMKPPIMGGDPQKALEFFEKHLQVTQGKFLLTYVYLAQYYAAKILDEEKFDHYLDIVLQTPLEVLPEAKLLNQIAKKKARRLMGLKDQLF